MKNIILVSFLFISSLSYGQGKYPIKTPVTLNKGTNGATDSTANYFTINGQDYPRGGYLVFNYAYNIPDTIIYHAGDTSIVHADSTIGIYYGNTLYTALPPTIDTLFIYGDSTNEVMRYMPGLRAWFRKYAY